MANSPEYEYGFTLPEQQTGMSPQTKQDLGSVGGTDSQSVRKAAGNVYGAGILGLQKQPEMPTPTADQLKMLQDQSTREFGKLQELFEQLDMARQQLAMEEVEIAQRGEINPDDSMKMFALQMMARFAGARDKFVQASADSYLERENARLDQQYKEQQLMNNEDFRQRAAQGQAGIQGIQDQAEYTQSIIRQTASDIDNLNRQLITDKNNEARIAMNDADNAANIAMNNADNERLIKQAELELEQSREVTDRMTDQAAAKELADLYDDTRDALAELGESIGVPSLGLKFIVSVAKLVEGGMSKDEAISRVAEEMDEEYGNRPVIQKTKASDSGDAVEAEAPIVTEKVLGDLELSIERGEASIAAIEKQIKELNEKGGPGRGTDTSPLRKRKAELSAQLILDKAMLEEAKKRFKKQAKDGTEPLGLNLDTIPKNAGSGPSPTGPMG